MNKQQSDSDEQSSAFLAAYTLDNLAHSMRDAGAQLEEHGVNYCDLSLARSRELLGAADMVRDWVKNLRVSDEKKTKKQN